MDIGYPNNYTSTWIVILHILLLTVSLLYVGQIRIIWGDLIQNLIDETIETDIYIYEFCY